MTGEGLRKKRLKLGYSKAEMARRLGIGRNTYARQERARQVYLWLAIAARCLADHGGLG